MCHYINNLELFFEDYRALLCGQGLAGGGGGGVDRHTPLEGH